MRDVINGVVDHQRGPTGASVWTHLIAAICGRSPWGGRGGGGGLGSLLMFADVAKLARVHPVQAQ